MVKIISMFLFAVIVFAGGMAGSWMLHQSKKDALPAGETELAEGPSTPVGKTSAAGVGAMPSQIRTPIRVDAMTPADVFRVAASIRAAQEALKKRELEIKKEMDRLKLVRADLRGQYQELDGLDKRIKDNLEAMERTQSQLLKQRQDLELNRKQAKEDIQKLENLQAVASRNEVANLEELADLLKGLPPADTASIFKSMVNNGKLKDVLVIMAAMEAKDASNVLSALRDPKLVTMLLEGYKGRIRKDQNGDTTGI